MQLFILKCTVGMDEPAKLEEQIFQDSRGYGSEEMDVATNVLAGEMDRVAMQEPEEAGIVIMYRELAEPTLIN